MLRRIPCAPFFFGDSAATVTAPNNHRGHNIVNVIVEPALTLRKWRL